MVSLVDIGPAKAEVEIRGNKIPLVGITSAHIVGMLLSFPEMRRILAEKEADVALLVSQFPLAVGMMIAAAMGNEGKEEEVNAAMALPVGEQTEILQKVFEISFPKGAQSFLDVVGAALRSAGVPGWDQAMKLHVPSSPASEQDEANKTAGTVQSDSSTDGASSLPATTSQETKP